MKNKTENKTYKHLIKMTKAELMDLIIMQDEIIEDLNKEIK